VSTIPEGGGGKMPKEGWDGRAGVGEGRVGENIYATRIGPHWAKGGIRLKKGMTVGF